MALTIKSSITQDILKSIQNKNEEGLAFILRDTLKIPEPAQQTNEDYKTLDTHFVNPLINETYLLFLENIQSDKVQQEGWNWFVTVIPKYLTKEQSCILFTSLSILHDHHFNGIPPEIFSNMQLIEKSFKSKKITDTYHQNLFLFLNHLLVTRQTELFKTILTTFNPKNPLQSNSLYVSYSSRYSRGCKTISLAKKIGLADVAWIQGDEELIQHCQTIGLREVLPTHERVKLLTEDIFFDQFREENKTLLYRAIELHERNILQTIKKIPETINHKQPKRL